MNGSTKRGTIGISILLALLIAGCQGAGPSKTSATEDYHTGSQGIVMTFINNAPPSRIYEGDSLDISVQLENRGAYPEGNLLQGKLEISGFDATAIRGSWDGGNSIPTSLEGKSQGNPEGGIAIMTYRDRDGVHVPFDADYYDVPILVHSCYKYQTTADAIVCIDPDPFEVVQEKKVCQYTDSVQTGGSQGAPVAVTKVEQEVGSDQLFFRIYVSNVGGGSVMVPSSYNQCPFDVDFQDLDKVIATVKLPHDASPDCTPKGTTSDPIRLTNGQGYIFCRFDKPAANSAYTTSLNVDLDYVYSSSIEKQMRIVNLK